VAHQLVSTRRFGTVTIYPVGILQAFLMYVVHGNLATVKLFTARLRRDWCRRSAWNGFLAEPDDCRNIGRCGHGWTRHRALMDLHRAADTSAWYQHSVCAHSRIAAPEQGWFQRHGIYCATCGTWGPESEYVRERGVHG
jgi:hypothetical protein